MRKKKPDRSTLDIAGTKAVGRTQSFEESMRDIPEFTPRQWRWLRQQSHRFQKDYVPTRSLIPGL